MKVLISDKIHDSALKYLSEHKIEVSYQPEITMENLLSEIPQYEGLIVRSRTKVTVEVIENGKSLKIIGRVGSGVDNIDIEASRKRKITVINAPDANSQAVAEHTLGLAIALLRNYPKAFASMKNGLWLKKELSGSEIEGKSVGILGYGHIGKKVERFFKAFGAATQVYSRSYQTASLPQLFQNSDLITIHLALTADTKKLVGDKLLSLMKPNAYLINTSRGEIIDENVLYAILNGNKIAGAALDVYGSEPLPSDSKWRKLDNVILTPHIGASTREALTKASICVVRDIVNFANRQEVKNMVI